MVSTPDDALDQWLENSLCYLVDTVDPSRSCGETVLAKLAEVLFVETLRCYITLPSPGQTGWLAGVRMNLIDIECVTNVPYMFVSNVRAVVSRLLELGEGRLGEFREHGLRGLEM